MGKAKATTIRTGKDRPKKARVFNIVQYEHDPIAAAMGLPPVSFNFGESTILAGVAHQTINRYAYIRHDKDPYNEVEIMERQESVDARAQKQGIMPSGSDHYPMVVNTGSPKEPHWHVVVECSYSITVDTIARWFGVPENQVDVPSGKNAFLDCVEYLRHSDIKQKEAGKYEYDANDVKANFDWKPEVEAYTERRTRYGRRVSDRDWYRNEVLSGRMTPKQVFTENPTAYTSDSSTLTRLRGEYLATYAPMPPLRINFYVDGASGIGKSALSRALARSLFPEYDNDDDLFFVAGARGVAFDGYAGQPVIIWDDRRAIDFITELGSRDNVFAYFDPHPVRKAQNIKYGKTMPINTVNIINGIDSYTAFLDGLAGEYTDKSGVRHTAEDKTQAYRRMPFILRVSEDFISFYANRGWLDRSDYREYARVCNIRSKLRELLQMSGEQSAFSRSVQAEALRPITDKYHAIYSEHTKPVDKDAVLEWLKENEYGVEYSDQEWAEFEGQKENEREAEKAYETWKATQETEQARSEAESERLIDLYVDLIDTCTDADWQAYFSQKQPMPKHGPLDKCRNITRSEYNPCGVCQYREVCTYEHSLPKDVLEPDPFGEPQK